jgi:hypothetical protein
MKPQSSPVKPRPQNEIVRLMWLAIFISVFSFLFYYRDGGVLLYGDAVAHINIARRVLDSRTPSLLQLGTVWLPLPHLLILPFIVSKQMWQSGSGGSIPSMAAFVLGVLGIFRLVRIALGPDREGDYTARIGAWTAALLYAANPNLIYMQATAMGESLYLACFIWAVACFAEFARGNPKSLTKCGLCLLAACLTRYDGWFLAVLIVIAVTFRREARTDYNAQNPNKNDRESPKHSLIVVTKFILIAAAGPVLWLAYNAAVYRNPLEFANGPYSAKAIERTTATVNPARGNLLAAGSYFLKAAELNVSESTWPGRLWLGLALLGSLAAWFSRRGRAAFLLWAPLPFYALALAYGSATIFIPPWWPFSIYNVRYGIELLPAFAVFVPLGISFLIQSATKLVRNQATWRQWSPPATLLGILLLGASSYAAIWRVEPICHREAEINSRGRLSLDRQLGDWITKLPPDSTLLMYLGLHVGALERAGIPLRRTINEGNHRVWKQPVDQEGLWERALANPAAYADYVVGFEGDPAWKAAEDRHLTALVEIHTTGQPAAVIFQARPWSSTQNGTR